VGTDKIEVNYRIFSTFIYDVLYKYMQDFLTLF